MDEGSRDGVEASDERDGTVARVELGAAPAVRVELRDAAAPVGVELRIAPAPVVGWSDMVTLYCCRGLAKGGWAGRLEGLN